MAKLWLRMGAAIELSKADVLELVTGEGGLGGFAADRSAAAKNLHKLINKAIEQGTLELGGDTYIPVPVAEEFGLIEIGSLSCDLTCCFVKKV